MSISNQKILIVGGGSGMGLALARRCVEAGAIVIIAGRGENRLRQARETLGNPDEALARWPSGCPSGELATR